MGPFEPRPDSADPIAKGEDGDLDSESSDPARAPAPVHFWRILLASVAAQAGLCWVLDAIPVNFGESLVLRWLRALVEHPVRGPLGLALVAVAIVQLVRAALNRHSRT